MSRTTIEWTQETWNPTRGCSRISPGCEHCYAEIMAARFSDEGMWGHGFAERGKSGARWTRRLALVTDADFPGHGKLDLPLHWREPRRVFVNSTSDLFHESLTNEQIAAVFGVMAACPRHTFQVLTKRAKRMREWFEWVARGAEIEGVFYGTPGAVCAAAAAWALTVDGMFDERINNGIMAPWPLLNVWLGVSTESQEYADERIHELLKVPAAIHFVSYEPALGPVDFSPWLHALRPMTEDRFRELSAGIPDYAGTDLEDVRAKMRAASPPAALDWVIGGSESGPGARPMDPAWLRAAADQCIAAGVAFFTKQIATEAGRAAGVHKGGDPAHWPHGVWPRQFPQVQP